MADDPFNQRRSMEGSLHQLELTLKDERGEEMGGEKKKRVGRRKERRNSDGGKRRRGKKREGENDSSRRRKRRRGRGESMKLDLIYSCDTLQSF